MAKSSRSRRLWTIVTVHVASTLCPCGEAQQTVNHIINNDCSRYKVPRKDQTLKTTQADTSKWLQTPNIA